MLYTENRFRVVDSDDRNTTVKTFASLAPAQQFLAHAKRRYEIQRAVEAEDGTVAWWERTAIGSRYDSRSEEAGRG